MNAKTLSFLTQEEKQKAIDEIIRFFKEEKDENIGIIQAGNFLEFVEKSIGNKIYNKAVEDSSKLIEIQIENIQLELETLKQE